MELVAINTVAVLTPELRGLNVIEKVVFKPDAIFTLVELESAEKSNGSELEILAIGEEVRCKLAFPAFSIVNSTAGLEE